MKRKAIMILGALAALTFGLALAGCAQERLSIEDLIEQGYVNRVTFDLMGGKSGDRNELVQYVRDNSLVVEPGTKQLTGEEPAREGYTFGNYYHGTKDEDGNVTLGERWDFAKDRVTEDTTIYVRWLENYTITVHHGENYEKSSTVAVTQTSEGVAQPVTSISIANYTVLGVFASREEAEKEDGQQIEFPYTPQDLSHPDNTVSELWAHTLEGSWRLVYDVDDFRMYSSTNIYLMADLDFKGEELELPEEYSGTFEGNGHKLSNFTVSQPMPQGSGTFSFGLFRELRAGAQIRNVTFENVTFTANLTNPKVVEYRAGILAGYAAGDVQVQNVTIGGTFTFVIVAEDRGETLPFFEELFPDNEKTLIGGTPAGVTVENCSVDGVELRKLTPEQAEETTDNPES